MIRLAAVLLALCAALWPFAAPAEAHRILTGHAAIAESDDGVLLSLSFDYRDMIEDFPLDPNGDRRVTPEELAAGLPALIDYITAHLTLAAGDTPLPLRDWEGAIETDASGSEWLRLRATAPSAGGQLIRLSLAPDWFELFGQRYTLLVKFESSVATAQDTLTLDHLTAEGIAPPEERQY